MGDPNLQIREGGSSQKNFFGPFGPQFGLNIRARATHALLLDPLLKGQCKSPCPLQLLSNGYRQEKCDNYLLMSKEKLEFKFVLIRV